MHRAEGNQIHRLIADLDSDDFNTREKASADLARIGAGAEYALLGTLAGGKDGRRRPAVSINGATRKVFAKILAAPVERDRVTITP